MPDMPTITVTAAQQTQILEAYKDLFGTSTQAETVAAYKQMIADMVKATVKDYQRRKIQTQAFTDMKAAEDAADAAMQGF